MLEYLALQKHAGIAQSVEQLIRNQQVVCSSHITRSTRKPLYIKGLRVFTFSGSPARKIRSTDKSTDMSKKCLFSKKAAPYSERLLLCSGLLDCLGDNPGGAALAFLIGVRVHTKRCCLVCMSKHLRH